MALIKVHKVDTDAFKVLAVVRGGRFLHRMTFPSFEEAKAAADRMRAPLKPATKARFQESEHWVTWQAYHGQTEIPRPKAPPKAPERRDLERPSAKNTEQGIQHFRQAASQSLAETASSWLSDPEDDISRAG